MTRLDAALRAGAEELKIKAGQMFQPIRVAVCGRKNAPPLFETLEVLGRETCLKRIDQAIRCCSSAPSFHEQETETMNPTNERDRHRPAATPGAPPSRPTSSARSSSTI